MAIQVTCPGCMARFTVADEHGGKQGPCPKCKKPITIPKAEDQIVIHAPKGEGPTNKEGKRVLKTVKRKDTAFSPLIATGVGVTVLLTLLAAFLLRGYPDTAGSYPILGGGALLLGPLLAWAGYLFLRDQELEPYQGGPLWIRALVCGLVYALAWGIYLLIASQIGETGWQQNGLEIWQMGFAAAVAVGIGTFAAFVSLDLEPLMGFLHCALYFAVTVGLRFVMALPPLPGLKGD
ncbi:hypothetical protein [Botrimarina hoheduenensis]|uniref:Uncharacterized protein n=1 Tax=Botrimarina hoheduenensis TaxID=2528000 RepID=A0A5C5WF00_9BACT|nr:hypothetical protein [Botrimarina hoheduenensis]TWT48659.1 hypothetical protein Pla111_04340 [Botrimarina hoheduenensis]